MYISDNLFSGSEITSGNARQLVKKYTNQMK